MGSRTAIVDVLKIINFLTKQAPYKLFFVHLHRVRYICFNPFVMYEQLKLNNQVCFKMYTASRLVMQAYHPLLEPLGLTYPQYLVLLVLWEQDNQLVGDLSRRLLLDTNTLTPLLKRMESNELIVRTRGIADGRQTLISLTKKGQHLEEAAKDIPAAFERRWQGESPDGQQSAAFVDALDAMVENLKK